jgi:hypothetical protein
VKAFLDDLRSRGVVLTVRGEKLRYDAPKGVMTADLVDYLLKHKPELIKLLACSPTLGVPAAAPVSAAALSLTPPMPAPVPPPAKRYEPVIYLGDCREVGEPEPAAPAAAPPPGVERPPAVTPTPAIPQEVSLRTLLRAALEDDTPRLAAADLLTAIGHEDLAAKLRIRDDSPVVIWMNRLTVYWACFDRGLLRRENEPVHQQALAFEAALNSIDLTTFPAVTEDNLSGKELAAEVRKLLRRLGFSRLRVQANMGTVFITIPHRLDLVGAQMEEGETYIDFHRRLGGGPDRRLHRLLAAAFPGASRSGWHSGHSGEHAATSDDPYLPGITLLYAHLFDETSV